MRVIFQFEVPQVKKQGSIIDGAELVSPVVNMRLAPVKGLHVIAIRGDDYRCIVGVYENVARPRDPVRVFLAYDGRANLAALKKLGWKETR